MFQFFRRRFAPAGPDSSKISFIVICYDMEREVKRTLESLSRRYQTGAKDVDYEVILVDNGSPKPFPASFVKKLGKNFSCHYIEKENASHSPAAAINFGVQQATGDRVCIMIDGARMLSPGVVQWAAYIFNLHPNPVISVLGFHLGPSTQRESVQYGYSKELEDRLLDGIDWKKNGYKLFRIASLAASSSGGWFAPMAESNCLFMNKRLFLELGGYDESFSTPGGGLVNLDFYKRAVETKGTELFYILGEGCFHQLHGGVTTGGGEKSYTMDDFREQYIAIRGSEFSRPQVTPVLIGKNNFHAVPMVKSAASKVMENRNLNATIESMIAIVGDIPDGLREKYFRNNLP